MQHATMVNKIREKYGKNSEQYMAALSTIEVYGDKGNRVSGMLGHILVKGEC